MPGEEVKQRLRTGTVVTTDDRNWSFCYPHRRCDSTLAARSRLIWEKRDDCSPWLCFPRAYGTLLCVSDKPYTVKLNRSGQANRFYEGLLFEHLQIGIRVIDLLRAEQ